MSIFKTEEKQYGSKKSPGGIFYFLIIPAFFSTAYAPYLLIVLIAWVEIVSGKYFFSSGT